MEAPNPFDAQDPAAGARSSAPRKRKNHRAGKKKKASRRKSFAALADDMPQGDDHDNGTSSSRPTFYGTRDNLSRTSIDSSTLHDHRYAITYLGCSTSIADKKLTEQFSSEINLSFGLDDPRTHRHPSNIHSRHLRVLAD